MARAAPKLTFLYVWCERGSAMLLLCTGEILKFLQKILYISAASRPYVTWHEKECKDTYRSYYAQREPYLALEKEFTSVSSFCVIYMWIHWNVNPVNWEPAKCSRVQGRQENEKNCTEVLFSTYWSAAGHILWTLRFQLIFFIANSKFTQSSFSFVRMSMHAFQGEVVNHVMHPRE